jgi:hypothetical protein
LARQPADLKRYDKGRLGRLSNPTGRPGSEAWAGLEVNPPASSTGMRCDLMIDDRRRQ